MLATHGWDHLHPSQVSGWTVSHLVGQITRAASQQVSQASVDAIVHASTATGAQTHPIVLLHDAPGFRANTVAALPRIIEWYRANGYLFGDLLATRSDGNLGAYLGSRRPAGPFQIGTRYNALTLLTGVG